MNTCSNMSNEEHIDRIIASMKAHPKVWDAASREARITARDAAFNAALEAARFTPKDATRDAGRRATLIANMNMAKNVELDAAWSGALGAVLALVAYFDAAKYLEMPSDKLKIYAILSEEPAAVLMLLAVIAFERIREMETA